MHTFSPGMQCTPTLGGSRPADAHAPRKRITMLVPRLSSVDAAVFLRAVDEETTRVLVPVLLKSAPPSLNFPCLFQAIGWQARRFTLHEVST